MLMCLKCTSCGYYFIQLDEGNDSSNCPKCNEEGVLIEPSVYFRGKDVEEKLSKLDSLPPRKYSYSFIGVPTGDGECFCWSVDQGTYKEIVGEETFNRDAEYAMKVHGEDLTQKEDGFLVYPNDVLGQMEKNQKYQFSVMVEEI